ncbi:MAG: hypothetical protein KC613_22355 [Myxococcales bacterium]|nr:hypothetical protein [Myxococcales bacterium]MCB9525831.1 hypothetical protein [Myxococcales bacterium]
MKYSRMIAAGLALGAAALVPGCNFEPKRRSRPDEAPATLAQAVNHDAPNYLRRAGVICEFPGDPAAPKLILDAYEGIGRLMGRFLVEEVGPPRQIRPGPHVEARMRPEWPTGWYATKFDQYDIELDILQAATPPEDGRAWEGKARITADGATRPVACRVVGE